MSPWWRRIGRPGRAPSAVLTRGKLVFISGQRRVLSLLFMAAAIGSILVAPFFRNLEAFIAPWTFTRLGMGPSRYLSGGDFLAMGTGVPIRFTISLQCGAMFLVVPLLFAAALVIRSPNVSVFRAIVSVLLGSLILVSSNQVRIAIIGACSRWFGFKQGFPLGHLLIGSLFSLLAIAVSVMSFLRVVKSPESVRPPKISTIRGKL